MLFKNLIMPDLRYDVTPEEEAIIINTYISQTNSPALKRYPAREKKKIVILKEICKQFESNKKYAESDLNLILEKFLDDTATLRRGLVSYGLMERERDGSLYWLTH